MNMRTESIDQPVLRARAQDNLLWAAALALLALTLTAACGPTDEEIAILVAGEIERQVAHIPSAPQGNTGPEGPQGPQGVEGPQGLTGPLGDTGPEGPRGMAGPEGPVGPAGPLGLRGPKGPDGHAGPAGPPGTAGPQGPRGILGLPTEHDGVKVRNVQIGRARIYGPDWTSNALQISPGTTRIVATINWGTAGIIGGGTVTGMRLTSGNTVFCIHRGTARLC